MSTPNKTPNLEENSIPIDEEEEVEENQPTSRNYAINNSNPQSYNDGRNLTGFAKWKGLILGNFSKQNIIPAILNILTLCFLINILTTCSFVFTNSPTWQGPPVWLIVIGGISIVSGFIAQILHSFVVIFIFLLLNALCLGYISYGMYEKSNNQLGVLFSFLLIGQVKAVELVSLYWQEFKGLQQRQEQFSIGEEHDGRERLEDE
ncbi:hypothetical protein ABK040_007174 [Willaertia magna]